MSYSDKEGLDAFAVLTDLLLWSKPDGILAMLNAYVDASTQERTLTVAITAYDGDGAKKANQEWVQLWGEDLACHMTDLHAKRDAFKGWSEERAGDMLKASIAIVDAHAPFCAAVTVNIDEYAQIAPTEAQGERAPYLDLIATPYAFCSHMAMLTLAELAGGDDAGERDIFYFVESGDEHQGQLKRYMSYAQDVDILRDLYRLAAHTVIDKPVARLLESADIFAWEWTRHCNRKVGDAIVRRSLGALLRMEQDAIRGKQVIYTPARYAAQYDAEVLGKHMPWFRTWLSGAAPSEGGAREISP